MCRTCDQAKYGPPLNIHYATLDGPAVVRISNATYIPTDGGPKSSLLVEDEVFDWPGHLHVVAG
jgi:hypothetical protein